MPSPDRGKRTSSTSAGRQSAATIRRGDVKISDPLSLSKDLADVSRLGPPDSDMQYLVTTSASDSTWPRRSTPPENATSPASEGGLVNPSRMAVNRESTLPSSMQLNAMSSKTSLKQRKSGGFRATIRSLFGSKRHRSLLSDDGSYHISDPGNLVAIREATIHRHVTRTPSHTFAGITQASPLGSHSPHAPLNGLRTRSVETISPTARHRRRNTLPSIVFSDQDAQQIRNVVQVTTAKQALDMISRSDEGSQMPKALKRRSRSADALTDLIASQVQSPSTLRQSLIDQPLPTLETRGVHGVRNTGTSMSTMRSSQLNSTVSSTSLKKPVQDFDFGLLADVSLEDRVKTLELKCVNFEYAIAGLQGYDIDTPAPSSRPPKRRSIHELFVETGAPPSSRAPSRQGLTFLKSPTDSSSLSDEDLKQMQRSSAATIRPANTIARSKSPKRSATSSPITINQKGEHYSDLLAMIREERAARKQLEVRVSELQKQVSAYATTQPINYATPSPESFRSEQIESRARPLHRTPAFPRRSRNNITETSRFSVSDTEESDLDGGFHDAQDIYGTPPTNTYPFNSMEISPRPTVEIF